MRRRKFLKYTAALSAVTPVIKACKPQRTVPGKIIGASANVGHLLRDFKGGKPTELKQVDIVIIGGGVSGLSAARWLKKNGIEDFLVLDLEKDMGGNAASGRNEISAFPWGAHYVPIPNNDLQEYVDFLAESNVIVGYNEQGLPVYNDLHLCFDPQERLFINGRWQVGLIPQYGVPAKDRKQIRAFMKLMEQYRYAKGSDGKDAFAIPVDHSSKDEQFTSLDTITVKDWLHSQKLDSEYLHWYLNYCTRDDFGTAYDKASAWVGIHYFAARKGKGANAQHQDVLTWPEGNGFLVKNLSKDIDKHFLNDSLALQVSMHDEQVMVEYLDVATKQLKAISAKSAIICTPQFVNSRLLINEPRAQLVREHMSYVPWMVANIKVKKLAEKEGAPLSWDNVIYNSDSLGYVHATQQLLQQKTEPDNITYYLPLTNGLPAEARTGALKKTHAQWSQEILNDLMVPHPLIADAVENIDIMVWGHAMAQPVPGTIHGPFRQVLQQPLENKVFFAHTDLAGISIFEEAFYQGIKAAKAVLQTRS